MAKLGGALIGYGIKKKNGEERKVIFDKPIHNTITKSCLNNLLKFNGGNGLSSNTQYPGLDMCSIFVKSVDFNGSSSRYGVFNSCALGNGTGVTSVDDTQLKNKIGDYTDTKKTGDGWCGYSLDYQNATIRLRVSHTHSINENFTIKEIGWFNRIYPDGVYSLSSRIQLDNFIDVESGDEFYSIYEIIVSFQDEEKVPEFSGLNVGGYSVNACTIPTYSNACCCFPYINTSGTGSIHISNGWPVVAQNSCWIDFVWTQVQYKVRILKSNWAKNKPITEQDARILNYDFVYESVVRDYTENSFYRDVEFTIPQSELGADVYGIEILGTLYRFGTFDGQENFTPTPITINNALKITCRQSWSTDLLTPAG
jgi:hypothetical protein